MKTLITATCVAVLTAASYYLYPEITEHQAVARYAAAAASQEAAIEHDACFDFIYDYNGYDGLHEMADIKRAKECVAIVNVEYRAAHMPLMEFKGSRVTLAN